MKPGGRKQVEVAIESAGAAAATKRGGQLRQLPSLLPLPRIRAGEEAKEQAMSREEEREREEARARGRLPSHPPP